LSWGKVVLFVFRVGEKKQDDASRNMPVVDHPQTTALAAARSGSAKLSKAAGTADQVAAIGVCHQRPLQGVQFFVGQDFSRLLAEERGFLEGESHPVKYPSMTDACQPGI
jgi:hypothetical protein